MIFINDINLTKYMPLEHYSSSDNIEMLPVTIPLKWEFLKIKKEYFITHK